jgi:plastocyanin
MRRTLIALTMLAAAGALAAGCGGNTSGSGGYGSGGASPATPAAPSGASSGGGRAYGGGPSSSAAGTTASGTAVAIDDFAFSSATLKVKVGQKVTWTNKQGVAHTVTADGAPSIIPCRRARRSCSPSSRRAASPTTAPSTRRCMPRSWCRSDLGRDQGSETATLSSGKPSAAPATRP